MNRFYDLPKIWQWVTALLLLVLTIVITLLWFQLFVWNVLGYLLIFIVVPIAQFLSTPFFKLAGFYTYVSPMLLVFGASNKKYDLHNGTSFDYLMVMRNTKPGAEWKRKMLSFYVEGLLAIIEKIQNKELPETVKIRGSSYFFTERTAKRLGFEIEKTGWFEKINLFINIIDLAWMFSLTHAKFRLPNLLNTKTAAITGAKLVSNKERLEKLHYYLNCNTTTS